MLFLLITPILSLSSVSSRFQSWLIRQVERQRKVLMLVESWIVNILIHFLISCWDFNHLSEFTQDELKGQNDY